MLSKLPLCLHRAVGLLNVNEDFFLCHPQTREGHELLNGPPVELGDGPRFPLSPRAGSAVGVNIVGSSGCTMHLRTVNGRHRC